MKLEEAIENTKKRIKSWESIAEIGKHTLCKEEYENSQNICEEQKILIEEIERLQKENKEKIEDIAYKTRLAEGDLEILEKHSINHWYNFAYVQEAVAVDNLRNRINDIQDLLKEE